MKIKSVVKEAILEMRKAYLESERMPLDVKVSILMREDFFMECQSEFPGEIVLGIDDFFMNGESAHGFPVYRVLPESLDQEFKIVVERKG